MNPRVPARIALLGLLCSLLVGAAPMPALAAGADSDDVTVYVSIAPRDPRIGPSSPDGELPATGGSPFAVLSFGVATLAVGGAVLLARRALPARLSAAGRRCSTGR